MFYIFDCNNDIVGNPKGYKTHRGAQMTGEKSRIYSIRWVD